MKKWWITIGIALLLIIVSGVVVWLMMNRHFDNNNPLGFIPRSASSVLKVNGTERFLQKLSESDFCAEFNASIVSDNLCKTFVMASNLFANASSQEPSVAKRTIYISSHNVGSSEVGLVSFALNNFAEWREITTMIQAETDGDDIYHVKNVYLTILEGCLFASSDKTMIEKVASQKEEPLSGDQCFCTLERTASPSAEASLFLNVGISNEHPLGIVGGYNLERFGKWAEFDIEIQKKNVVSNGFMTTEKHTIASMLAEHKPLPFRVDNQIPQCAQTFISYAAGKRGISDESYVKLLQQDGKYDDYVAKQNELSGSCGFNIEEQLSDVFSGDIALFSMSGTLTDTASVCLIVCTQNGTIAQATLNNAIGGLRKVETPNELEKLSPIPTISVPVYEAFADDDEMFFLKDMLPFIPRRYYIRYENTLMFADEISILQRTLYEILLSRTFANDADFRNFRSSFSDDNVFFAYSNSQSMCETISAKHGLDESNRQTLLKFYGFGFQLSNLSGLPYITTCGMYEPSRTELPPTLWQSKVDTTIVGRPYAVVNHNTLETEYIIQDASNMIHLVNPKGLILWSRKVDGPIVGGLCQIDYYNNKKLQYLFATPGSVHLIDRNGNNTAKFPIHLQVEASGPVKYIDYGNPAEFRLFVPCADRTIALYDKNCKRVDGWEMKHTEGLISREIKHFVNSNRDYLIAKDEYKLYITDRRGNERIHVAKPLAPNAYSDVYLVRQNTPEAAFVTSTPDGKMASVDIASGNVEFVDIDSIGRDRHYMLQLSADRFAFVSNRHYVVTDDKGQVVSHNRLYLSSVDNAEMTYDGKIALWDREESLGYLINGDGHVADGFPIPAKSPFTTVKNNGTDNIVVVGESSTLNDYIK
ncbi:MAG: hypothetical protein MJZ01_00635 [Bacteroidales bacterium]|nr:hypothetical protein [Bacteroidales bacterium]